jgi:hypothetical protein
LIKRISLRGDFFIYGPARYPARVSTIFYNVEGYSAVEVSDTTMLNTDVKVRQQ